MTTCTTCGGSVAAALSSRRVYVLLTRRGAANMPHQLRSAAEAAASRLCPAHLADEAVALIRGGRAPNQCPAYLALTVLAPDTLPGVQHRLQRNSLELQASYARAVLARSAPGGALHTAYRAILEAVERQRAEHDAPALLLLEPARTTVSGKMGRPQVTLT